MFQTDPEDIRESRHPEVERLGEKSVEAHKDVHPMRFLYGSTMA